MEEFPWLRKQNRKYTYLYVCATSVLDSCFSLIIIGLMYHFIAITGDIFAGSMHNDLDEETTSANGDRFGLSSASSLCSAGTTIAESSTPPPCTASVSAPFDPDDSAAAAGPSHAPEIGESIPSLYISYCANLPTFTYIIIIPLHVLAMF